MATSSSRTVPFVGQTAQLSRTVRDRDILLFTEISGDRNPLHYDDAAAKASRFGEIVVQGGVTSAILNAVVAQELPGPGTVFLNTNWAFRAPVRCGDIITGLNSPRQVLMRPRVAFDPYATGIDGVYICSAATPPGGGVHGMNGHNAALSALRHVAR